jgi:hypothetical protein
MQVWDGTGSGFMRFHEKGAPLGWIVENAVLQGAVDDCVSEASAQNLTYYQEDPVTSIEFPHMSGEVALKLAPRPSPNVGRPPAPHSASAGKLPQLALASGASLTAGLVVSSIKYATIMISKDATLSYAGRC